MYPNLKYLLKLKQQESQMQENAHMKSPKAEKQVKPLEA
jgi:hypothetical protein